jgi:hypothetical protein
MSPETTPSPDSGNHDARFVRNVLLKALLLFVVFNLLFMSADIVPLLARLSAYNVIFPGRTRLPYGEVPMRAYNISPLSLEAMFASHELTAGAKPEDEFRVLVIGDSSVWGFLLRPEETLSGNLNTGGYTTDDGRVLRVYNLGYPITSLFKDLMILDEAMQYEPDLVLWLVTLEAMPLSKQFTSALVQHNPQRARSLIDRYDLDLAPGEGDLIEPGLWQRTIVVQRRNLADLVRLQLYGAVWAATGIDQDYPETYPLRMSDLEDDETFFGLVPGDNLGDILAPEVLQAGLALAGEVPVMFVNQPIFVSDGENSDIRYNLNYPRWAYDEYRVWFGEQCEVYSWSCVDLWDLVQPPEFTNTAFHMSPPGTAQLAGTLVEAVLEFVGSSALE